MQWSHALFIYREKFKKVEGEYPTFIFPPMTKGTEIESKPAPKKQVEKMLRETIFEIGVPSGTTSGSFTLHSPRNFYVNGASQLGWDTESQTILG